MAFALAWRQRVAARCWRRGAHTGASGSVRERSSRSVVAVERLRRRSDFRAAASGARFSGRSFLLQARDRADNGAIRVGFTVSKQVGNAVERNRVRRRLREILRLSAAAAGTGNAALHAGHDYVLIGRRAALAAPFGAMMQELESALGQVHIAGRQAGRTTGDAGRSALHETGSSSRARRPRRARKPSERPLQEP